MLSLTIPSFSSKNFLILPHSDFLFTQNSLTFWFSQKSLIPPLLSIPSHSFSQIPSHSPFFAIPTPFFQYSLSLSCYNSPTLLLSEFLLTFPLSEFSSYIILFWNSLSPIPFLIIPSYPPSLNYLPPSLIISLSGSFCQNSLSCFFLSHTLSEFPHTLSLSQFLLTSSLRIPSPVSFSQYSHSLSFSQNSSHRSSLKFSQPLSLRILFHSPSLKFLFTFPLSESCHTFLLSEFLLSLHSEFPHTLPCSKFPLFFPSPQCSFSLSFSQNSLSSSFSHSSHTF